LNFSKDLVGEMPYTKVVVLDVIKKFVVKIIYESK